MVDYDLIIIGCGPGGFIAAKQASKKGLSVLMVEKAELGGICLNEGCIPTKTLLNSAKLYQHALEGQEFGIHCEKVTFDFKKMHTWKSEVVGKINKGVEAVLKSCNVDIVYGKAVLESPQSVRVDGKNYSAKNIILATGSSVAIPPIPGIEDNAFIQTSTEILNLEQVPQNLAVVGGGVIGLEFASFFSSLGSKVQVIEMEDEIVSFIDKDVGQTLRRAMNKIQFHLKATVSKIEKNEIWVEKGGQVETIKADLILIATGRKPNTREMGLEEIGLAMDRQGIKVNQQMQTNLKTVYAIGDVNGISQLAHSASRMGEIAVDHICGTDDFFNTRAVPWVIYSLPEAAGIGWNEAELIAEQIPYQKVKVPMAANARFLAENGSRGAGFCKIMFHKEQRNILGIQLIGAYSSEMIHSAVIMLENQMTVDQVKKFVFPHPTVSEIIRDAIADV